LKIFKIELQHTHWSIHTDTATNSNNRSQQGNQKMFHCSKWEDRKKKAKSCILELQQ